MSEESEEALQQKKMIEALAYTLFQSYSRDPEAPEGEELEYEAKATLWQGLPDLRQKWRVLASEAVAALNERGLKVVIGAQRKLDAAVNEFTVVPARVAYDLAEE